MYSTVSAPNYVHNIRRVAVFGVAQASPSTYPVDDFELDPSPEVLLTASQYHPGAQAYQVFGHSMSPEIEHGDIVLVNPHDGFHPRRPCLFKTPNGHVIKMRGLHKGKHALLSLNPDVPPVLAQGDFIACGCVYAVYEGAFRVRYIGDLRRG